MENTGVAEQSAQVAVEKWLTQIDFANYEESWNLTANIFRRNVSLDDWKKSILSVH